MSGQEIFELTGAGAGILSLLWQIAVQFLPTNEVRIVMKVLDDRSKEFNNMIERIEKIAVRLGTQRKTH